MLTQMHLVGTRHHVKSTQWTTFWGSYENKIVKAEITKQEYITFQSLSHDNTSKLTLGKLYGHAQKRSGEQFGCDFEHLFDTIVKEIYHPCLAVKRQKFLQFQ